MRFTTLKKGEDLRQLVRRLYPSRSRNMLREAEQALLRANPHLADLKDAPQGVPIIVPDVAGTEPVGTGLDERNLVVLLLQQAREQLGDLRPALAGRLQRQEEEAKATLTRARTPQLRRLAEREPELKKRLLAIASNAQAELQRVEALRALQEEATAELERDLDNFLDGQKTDVPSDTRDRINR
jgi:hypothetical protein